MNKSDWLIIGVGNRYRHDDGVGRILAHRLTQQGITAQTHSGEGAGLINAWADFDKVIIIDATRSGMEPGTVQIINAIEHTIPTDLFHYSSHQFGLAQAVEMARILNRLPKQLWLIGIEGKTFDYGEQLSRELTDKLAQVETLVCKIIQADNNAQIEPIVGPANCT